MKRRLLLIGYGVVGRAVFKGLSRDKNNIIDVLDNPAGYTLPDLKYPNYDGVILCLPTPKGPMGECDDMMVEQYHRDIRSELPWVPILIKSTISLELIKLLEDDLALTYNPEFLREDGGDDQFIKQNFAIFGGNNARFWYSIYINSDITMSKVRFTSLINAGYAKYAINTFLATKVIFFNELKNMYSEEAFDELTDLISLDDRIGNSHMMVPGPDQKYGFGGKCFPKDTSAFAVSARNTGSPLKLLEKAIDINKEIRDEDSITK